LNFVSRSYIFLFKKRFFKKEFFVSISKAKHIVHVIYDGIANPVFYSQTLVPILNKINNDPTLHVTLISFERKGLSCDIMIKNIPAHERLHFMCAQRYRFFGLLSLLPAQMQLKRIFQSIKVIDELVLRGPLAGYVALKALKAAHVLYLGKITVLARGLCAEEFRFTQEQAAHNFLQGMLNSYIYKNLREVEAYVYDKRRGQDFFVPLAIEAVSPALRDYLVQSFNAQETMIALAKHDIPAHIKPAQRIEWRAQVRVELGIAPDAHVYCYSGSSYSWQCIEETLEFFKAEYEKNPKSFLLILTQHTQQIKKLLAGFKFPAQAYRLLEVKPEHVARYLSAADSGILFRKKDIINWVSRPTKFLEYQAADLNIIHNQTVACIARKETFK
jgi:hypothetical protein